MAETAKPTRDEMVTKLIELMTDLNKMVTPDDFQNMDEAHLEMLLRHYGAYGPGIHVIGLG